MAIFQTTVDIVWLFAYLTGAFSFAFLATQPGNIFLQCGYAAVSLLLFTVALFGAAYPDVTPEDPLTK